jgi:tyrosyl-tRNA synthetase
MARSSLFQAATRPDLHVCGRCALKIRSRSGRRWISQRFIAKTADAELKWQEQALRIKQGKQKSMLTILEERGLVEQVTG